MTLTNLPLWWETMQKGGLLKSGIGDHHYQELLQYIKMKTEIAEFVWFALTGILVTSISYNYILNSGCKQSAEEMEKRHNEYVNQEKQIQNDQQQKQSSQTIYKTYE